VIRFGLPPPRFPPSHIAITFSPRPSAAFTGNANKAPKESSNPKNPPPKISAYESGTVASNKAK